MSSERQLAIELVLKIIKKAEFDKNWDEELGSLLDLIKEDE